MRVFMRVYMRTYACFYPRIMCVFVSGTVFVDLLSQPSYRLAIRTEGMIEDLVRNLKSDSQELQVHCSRAVFKVLSDPNFSRPIIAAYFGIYIRLLCFSCFSFLFFYVSSGRLLQFFFRITLSFLAQL